MLALIAFLPILATLILMMVFNWPAKWSLDVFGNLLHKGIILPTGEKSKNLYKKYWFCRGIIGCFHFLVAMIHQCPGRWTGVNTVSIEVINIQ